EFGRVVLKSPRILDGPFLAVGQGELHDLKALGDDAHGIAQWIINGMFNFIDVEVLVHLRDDGTAGAKARSTVVQVKDDGGVHELTALGLFLADETDAHEVAVEKAPTIPDCERILAIRLE